MDEKTCIVFNAVIKYLDDKRPAKNRAKLTQPYSPHSKFHERKIRQEVVKRNPPKRISRKSTKTGPEVCDAEYWSRITCRVLVL